MFGTLTVCGWRLETPCFLLGHLEGPDRTLYSWVVNYDFLFCLKLKHQLSLFLRMSILWPTDQLIHVGNILSHSALKQHI